MIHTCDLPKIGVCVHPSFGLAQTLKGLSACGVTRVRMDCPWNATDGTLAYAKGLAKAGVTLDLIVNGWEGQAKVDAQLVYVRQLVAAFPGCVDAIEGPNEVNNDPQSWGAATDPKGGGQMAHRTAAPAVQSYLYAAVKADPALSGIPVIDYTDEHPTKGAADVSNMHCYATDNRGVDWWITQDGLSKLRQAAGARPFFVTETGNRIDAQGELQQAQYTCQAVASLIQCGAAGGYLYALFDDATGRYGLCDSNGTPRLAATYLRHLLSALADNGRAFTPKPLRVTLTPPAGNADSNMQSVIVAKSDGSYLLLFWMWHPPAKPVTVSAAIDGSHAMTGLHIEDGTTKAYGRGNLSGYVYSFGVKVVALSAS